MTRNTDTVADRFVGATARGNLILAVTAIMIVAAIGFTLLFMQDPLVHEALHDFRHGAGITCH